MDMEMEGDEGDSSLTLVHVKEDALSVLSSIRREKKLQLMKKRWLMGVPKDFKLSKRSFNDLRKPKFSADMYLPEPFLRNDSVFVEVARGYLANCFSSFSKGQPMGNFVKQIVLPLSEDVATSRKRGRFVVQRVFLPLLDDLSNTALCSLADLVTRKSVKFEKTRSRLESVIKKYLPMIFENSSSVKDALRLQSQIVEVFRDPKNFKNHSRLERLEANVLVSKPSTSCVHDVHVILERLEDLSLHALDAMRRKLYMHPCSLYTEPCTNRTKKQLIGQLRKKIDKLLGQGLPHNLARALRVASLSMKLMNGHYDSTLPEFFEVSHETEVLQNEIFKAIWSVPNLPLDEVKKLLLLLELDAISDIHFMRTKIKNFLIECLFQCNELEIPESILRGISTINSYSSESTTRDTREKIEDELICMLNMGSCMKQLVWDLSKHPNIDQEFWGAYKDESEDGDSSNDDDFDDDHIDDKEVHCSNYEKVDILVGNVSFEATHMEKQEDVSAAMRKSSITSDKSLPEEDLHVLQERCHFMPMEEPCLPKKPEYLFPTLSELAKPSITDSDLSALQDVSGNEYLVIEGVCDEVSLFAHKFIGCLIEKLLKVEGNHLDSASRSYLLGGASVPEKQKGKMPESSCKDMVESNHLDSASRSCLLGGASVPAKQKGKMPESSCKDMDSLAFIRTLNELVPSFPKSGMRRLLEVLKQS